MMMKVPSSVKSIIKLFNSKSIKAKSYNIVSTSFPSLAVAYPHYVISNCIAAQLPSIQEEEEEVPLINLIGDN